MLDDPECKFILSGGKTLPVTYEFAGRLLIVRPEGEYPLGDILRVSQEALAGAACPAEPRYLLDVRASASMLRATSGRIFAIADAFHELAPHVGGRCAVLTGSLLQYGLARMGAGFASRHGVEIHVFRDMGEARRWLEVSEPDAEPHEA